MIDRNLMNECRHFLSGHGVQSMKDRLTALANSPHAEGGEDFYGESAAVKALTDRVTGLTGQQKTIFVPKGMIAQMAALRVHTARTGRPSVAIHRLSHFDFDEMGALERLHGLTILRTGSPQNPFTVADLDALGEKPGVVSVELPLRRAGYRLTPLDDLRAIAAWCRAWDVPLHIDGARGWGAAVAYDLELSEIAGLADSLYLSFYKELGGMGGCTLGGERSFIEEAKPWIERHGGLIFRAFPYAIAAQDGMDAHLGRLGEYQDTARKIAKSINVTEDMHTEPTVPHTGGFQIVLDVPPAAAEAALEELTRESGVWLTAGFYERRNENECAFDVEIGAAAAAMTHGQWVAHLATLVAKAREKAAAA
jgi:threonine aldolase